MGKIYDITESNEYFDLTLSYAAELIKSDNICKTNKNTIAGLRNYYEDANLFIDINNSYTRFEMTEKSAGKYCDKEYLGSWKFILSNDCGKSLNIDPIVGNFYLLNIKQKESSNLENIKQKKSVDLTTNELEDKLKIINVIFIGVHRDYVPYILENAHTGMLKLENEKFLLQDMLWEVFDLKILESPKSIISSCSSKPYLPETSEIANIMAHQTVVSDMMGNKQMLYWLQEKSKENYSDFENFYVTISNCNIIMQYYMGIDTSNTLKNKEKPKVSIKQRITDIILSIFVLDNILVKIGFLRMIQASLEKDMKNPHLSNFDLMRTNLHINELNNLWNEKIFIYPVTVEFAKKIENNFNLKELKQEIITLQQAFERMSLMQFSLQEKLTDRKSQNLFKLFTILSALTATFTILSEFFGDVDKWWKFLWLFIVLTVCILIIYIFPIMFKKRSLKNLFSKMYKSKKNKD